MMYQQHDVLMETVKMHCQKMYMMWNKVLWKKKKEKKKNFGECMQNTKKTQKYI